MSVPAYSRPYLAEHERRCGAPGEHPARRTVPPPPPTHPGVLALLDLARHQERHREQAQTQQLTDLIRDLINTRPDLAHRTP